MRGRRVAAAVVVAAVAAVGATTATGKPKAGAPIIIGAAIDESGQMSPFNDPALTAELRSFDFQKALDYAVGGTDTSR